MGSRRIYGFVFSALLICGVVAMSGTTTLAQWNNNNRNNNRNWDGYPNWGGSFDLRQTALNAGFNEGTSAGQKDGSRHKRSNFNDFSQYRSASHDYSNKLGDKSLYQRYYRLAFEHGYEGQMTTYGMAQQNNNWDNGNNGNWNNGNNGNNGNWNGNNNNGNNGNWNGNNNNGNNGNGTRRGRNWGSYGSYGLDANSRQTALNAGYNEGIKQGRKDRGRNQHNLNDFSSYRKADTDYKSKNGDLAIYQRYYREGFENGYADGNNGY